MTVDSNTLQTFSLLGIREDLQDVIWNVSPYATPVLDRIGKTDATQPQHDWQTDTLAAAASNAHVQGETFAADSRAATVRIHNFCQIQKKQVEIAGTVLASKMAGRKDEYTYQLALKAARELKTDMEKALLSNQSATAGNSSTAALMVPITAWYATNVTNIGSAGANPTLSSGTPTTGRTDGAVNALTESLLQAGMQGVWASSTDTPDVVVVNTANRQLISAFAGPTGTQRVNDAEGRRLVATIKVYESDYGDLEIVPDRFGRQRDVHLLNTEYFAAAFLRSFVTEDLAKTGDNERGHIIVEWCVESRNEAASGLIADTHTG